MKNYREYLGRAVEFLPDGVEAVSTVLEIINVARDSLATDLAGRRIVIPGEIQRLLEGRIETVADLYAEMRDPKGLNWFHRKAIDHLPLRIRCLLTGVDWTTVTVVDDSDLYCRSSIQAALQRIQNTE